MDVLIDTSVTGEHQTLFATVLLLLLLCSFNSDVGKNLENSSGGKQHMCIM